VWGRRTARVGVDAEGMTVTRPNRKCLRGFSGVPLSRILSATSPIHVYGDIIMCTGQILQPIRARVNRLHLASVSCWTCPNTYSTRSYPQTITAVFRVDIGNVSVSILNRLAHVSNHTRHTTCCLTCRICRCVQVYIQKKKKKPGHHTSDDCCSRNTNAHVLTWSPISLERKYFCRTRRSVNISNRFSFLYHKS